MKLKLPLFSNPLTKGVDETGVTGLSHHLGSLDVTDAEGDLGDGVGANQLHEDHVGAVAHLRLYRGQLHHLEGGRQQSCRLGEKVLQLTLH